MACKRKLNDRTEVLKLSNGALNEDDKAMKRLKIADSIEKKDGDTSLCKCSERIGDESWCVKCGLAIVVDTKENEEETQKKRLGSSKSGEEVAHPPTHVDVDVAAKVRHGQRSLHACCTCMEWNNTTG